MARAISVSHFLSTNKKVIELEGEFENSFGRPEVGIPWIILAEVGSGKTTFTSMLIKYLSKFGKVYYDSIEEGDGESLKLAWSKVGMIEAARRVLLLDRENIEELILRLKKKRKPKFVVLDSIQHSDLTRQSYLELRNTFPTITFIFISHMDGRRPEGNLAKFIYQDSGVKILLKGFVAFPKSRFGGNAPFIVWPEGAAKFHGTQILNQ
jgi:hypothetical protein